MKKLPFTKDIESKNVLRRLARAHRALAELKGMASSIPNQNILINTLGLQEAKVSLKIDNLITPMMIFIKLSGVSSICKGYFWDSNLIETHSAP